jgi:hypothetical protein
VALVTYEVPLRSVEQKKTQDPRLQTKGGALRNGAAFVTRFDVALGSDLEIRIPFSHYASRRLEADFATQGRVVHVGNSDTEGERLVGVQFIRAALFT